MTHFSRFFSLAAIVCATLLPVAATASDHHGGYGGHGHYYGGGHYGYGGRYYGGRYFGGGPYFNFYYGPGFYGPGYDPYYYGPGPGYGPAYGPPGVYYGRTVGPGGPGGPGGPSGPGGDSLAADVQFALKRLGYYKGEPDGEIGAVSRAAIRAFQSEHGLPVTGRIDRPLLHALKLA